MHAFQVHYARWKAVLLMLFRCNVRWVLRLLWWTDRSGSGSNVPRRSTLACDRSLLFLQHMQVTKIVKIPFDWIVHTKSLWIACTDVPFSEDHSCLEEERFTVQLHAAKVSHQHHRTVLVPGFVCRGSVRNRWTSHRQTTNRQHLQHHHWWRHRRRFVRCVVRKLYAVRKWADALCNAIRKSIKSNKPGNMRNWAYDFQRRTDHNIRVRCRHRIPLTKDWIVFCWSEIWRNYWQIEVSRLYYLCEVNALWTAILLLFRSATGAPSSSRIAAIRAAVT